MPIPKTPTEPLGSVSAVTTTGSSITTIVASIDKSRPVGPIETVEYEAGMYRQTIEVLLEYPDRLPPELFLRNAVTEAALLHTRILCDVFFRDEKPSRLGLNANDIAMIELLPDWMSASDGKDGKYDDLKKAIKELEDAYGPKNQKDPRFKASPRSKINKLVMHGTDLRAGSGDYTDLSKKLRPLIEKVIQGVECHTRAFKPVL